MPDDSASAAPAPDGLAGQLFTSTAATGRALVKDKPLTIAFRERGEVGLNAGCNGMGGTQVFSGAELKVEKIVSTMMACVDPGGGNQLMDQENWYRKWLTAGVSWTLTGSTLTLSADGVTVTFERTGPADEKSSSAPTGGAGVATSSTAGSHPSVPAEHTPVTAPTAEVVTPAPPTSPGMTPPARPQPGGVSIPPQPPSK